ncbi:HupE/UreJ family protein [Haliangium sp.]|uniref:HupE/UreJ family protein n=1 Tax=Haliangium sp. TaxID=2663208 RepID=UPI003D0FC026
MSRSCSHDLSGLRSPRPHRAAVRLSLTVVVLTVIGLGAAPAWAHQGSVAHMTVGLDPTVGAAQARIDLELDAADAAALINLTPDAALTADTLDQDGPALLAYVADQVRVSTADGECVPEAGLVEFAPGGAVALSWPIACASPLSELTLDYELLFESDALHRALVQIVRGDDRTLAELSADNRSVRWTADAPAPAGGTAFVHSGVEHILFGFDHIAFLLALLLVVALRRPPGLTVGWDLRGLGAGLRRTAGIVTTFTVAHSLTLISASLGLVAIEGRLVESVIAASIVYVAVENVIRPAAPHRRLIIFAFGLVHGLGFASMLAALLPPGDVIVPLLLFNAGVELGQLAIVLAVLPLLYLAARALGPRRYRLIVVPFGSAVLATLGGLWLIERVCEISVLGF